MFKALWMVAAACLWAGSALAQCVPLPYTLTNGTIADANQVMANFNAVNTCAQGAAPTTATNAAMAALLTSSLPNKSVIRLGFAAVGDAPPLVYLTEAGTCASNGRVNDAGSCVNTTSGDGNSLYAVFPSSGADGREWGMNTTSGDNSAALTAACTWAAAAAPGGGMVILPAGTFNFTAAVTCSMPASAAQFTLRGGGKANTILNWNVASGGLTLNLNSIFNTFDIESFSLTTNQAGGGNALKIQQNAPSLEEWQQQLNTIRDMSFSGNDRTNAIGSGVNHWNVGIWVVAASFINYDSIDVIGQTSPAETNAGYFGANSIGVQLQGTQISATLYSSVVHNFINCNFSFLANAIAVVNPFGVEGITISKMNVQGGHNGVTVANVSTPVQQLMIDHSQFNVDEDAISLNGAVGYIVLDGNLVLIPFSTSVGFAMPGNFASSFQMVDFTVANNIFLCVNAVGPCGIGVQIDNNDGNNKSNVGPNNSFFKLTTGLSELSHSTFVFDYANVYPATTTPVGDAGTNNIHAQSCGGVTAATVTTNGGVVTHC